VGVKEWIVYIYVACFEKIKKNCSFIKTKKLWQRINPIYFVSPLNPKERKIGVDLSCRFRENIRTA